MCSVGVTTFMLGVTKEQIISVRIGDLLGGDHDNLGRGFFSVRVAFLVGLVLRSASRQHLAKFWHIIPTRQITCLLNDARRLDDSVQLTGVPEIDARNI